MQALAIANLIIVVLCIGLGAGGMTTNDEALVGGLTLAALLNAVLCILVLIG